MEIDEVLYSHLMADPLMILPPKRLPVARPFKWQVMIPNLEVSHCWYSTGGEKQIQPYWARNWNWQF